MRSRWLVKRDLSSSTDTDLVLALMRLVASANVAHTVRARGRLYALVGRATFSSG
jgi:hypothetical protein